ncbi:Hch1p Ecym_3598 [Eremothecium cymbalariae DBVPG|uniref:Activator of Hsp90 ATPase AHSA1-like N-terminal domain-containing protein n=1 Tax=Eremothecium cymbalariae (strain CBS 270.75 / DBVPG 7215 / KCTC 17166 / NRRL Y-17582) TaxID=931890 RepID=G8JQS9_ERECY|nr:Hypothetical protein Ecym_3598 [Eremothecium cymbalariae DBVPG\
MVVLNPNNWHWIDKNTLPWTKDYFNSKFNDWTIENGDSKFRVVSVSSISGDSNVTQRKGKVICYFDLKLEFTVAVSGHVLDNEEEDVCEGTISVPEFVHDECEFGIEYVGFGKQESVIRQQFTPKFVEELLKYQSTLVDAHSKDVQHTL